MAVDTIIEILPLALDPGSISSESPAHINYRGQPVPCWDLTRNLTGYPSKSEASTRIIIMKDLTDSGPGKRALIVEGLYSTKDYDPTKVIPADPAEMNLQRFFNDGGVMVEWVDSESPILRGKR